MRIRDSRDEPHYPEKGKLLQCQIQMNSLFKNNGKIIRRRRDRNIHKAMQVPVDINQTNKKTICYSSTKNAFKLEFADHLWLPFLDEPHSDIVVLAIINFHIYKILVTKWKHLIGPNDKITFNE